MYVKHNDKSTQFCLKVLIDTFKCLILPYLKSVVDIVCLIEVNIVVLLHSASSYTVTFYTALLD